MKIEGIDPINVGITLNNIGLVYNDKGDYAKALKCCKLSLDIDTKISGNDSIEVG